ncbi:MAG: AAA family ATPase [Oscillospiraceae bacterium]|nr:AAA family ATPase [Oscillospiraceae bacterium]
MLLKKLVVKDFRLFKGEQTIHFASEGEQNVTMIMGDNGTGKTTLAQIFTWCLYGETSFEDTILLCKATSAKMLTNSTETVRADLTLEHKNVEYTIITESRYQKTANGMIKPSGQLTRTIAFKKPDGTRDYVKELETEIRIKEILPKDLAKYFFFDGERIGNMSKELKRGRSQEFAGAVRSLLGLSAYTSALSHLNGKGSLTVLKSYDESYDAKSDSKIAEYGRQISALDRKIDAIDQRLTEIDDERGIASDRCGELTERIAKNKDSESLAVQKAELIRKRDVLINSRSSRVANVLRAFNRGAPSFFAKKMMRDALQTLAAAEKLDKGVPYINDKTIQFLIQKKKCICGTEVIAGNEAFAALNKLLDYIPPKSIGYMIGEFVGKCEDKSRAVENFFDEFCDNYKFVREFDDNKTEIDSNITNIEKRLEGLERVGGLQADLSRYEAAIRRLENEKDSINIIKGSHLRDKKEAEAARQELSNKNETNRKIEVYKAYARYMYDTLLEQYATEESKMRTQLQDTVNELFRSIYNGGFSLSLDDKYNIQINIIDQSDGLSEDVETSTAQSISVIFAFIAGVIKMARMSQQAENAMLVSEPYPLVMDAPLSAFDKTRIKTVCEVLPAVAEQVIIFIKDTDGDLANINLGSKVGKRYQFEKKNEFEAYIV